MIFLHEVPTSVTRWDLLSVQVGEWVPVMLSADGDPGSKVRQTEPLLITFLVEFFFTLFAFILRSFEKEK